MGSYSPLFPLPRLAEGNIPMEPVSMLASSDSISPKCFGDDNVELGGVPYKLHVKHCRRTYPYSTSGNSVRSLCITSRQSRETQHIRLIDARQLFLRLRAK